MRTSRVAVLAGPISVLTLAAGCGGSGDETAGTRESSTPSTAATPSATPSLAGQLLELGKTDVALSPGLVRSPEGFTPALTFDVTDGWSSVHRYADSFDVGLPDPDSDGPLVAVTFSVAPEPTGAAALAAIEDRVPNAKATSTTDELAGQQVGRLHLTGGTGTAFTSRDGSVSLDASDGFALDFLAADDPGGALVVGILTAAGPGQADGLQRAQALLDSIELTGASDG